MRHFHASFLVARRFTYLPTVIKKSGVRSIPKNPTLAQLVAGFEGVLDLLDWWLEKYILTHRIHVWVGDLLW